MPIVEAVQPRSAAPCLMMSPWISQASTPQLMKTTFLPVGIGLPTGVVSPMVVGRVVAFWASACALATPGPALPEAAEPPLEPSPESLPHPLAAERGADREHPDEVPQAVN